MSMSLTSESIQWRKRWEHLLCVEAKLEGGLKWALPNGHDSHIHLHGTLLTLVNAGCTEDAVIDVAAYYVRSHFLIPEIEFRLWEQLCVKVARSWWARIRLELAEYKLTCQ